MDAKQFLAEFGHIANAPGGIARLRELVYQFAITGRLTLQQEEDGSADDVLTNVARIRKQLIAEKKFKLSPKLESALLTPPTIALPLSWRWSRLLDLGEINPRNQVEEDSESVVMATFVPMAAVSEQHSITIAGEIRPWAEISKGYTHFANGDVLLAKITPCFENGKSAVVLGLEHNIGAGSTEFHVFRPISKDVNPAYVYLFVRSLLFRVKGEASMTGTAGQKRLPTEYFALCAMPLPPYKEQSRIVAKVDELMALCDKLETQQQQRRTLQNQLRKVTLQAVAASQSPHELKESWQRLQTNFGQLFSAPDDVNDLRAVVLNLAVKGNLTEQFDDNESAHLKLFEIRQVSSGQIVEGARRKAKVTYGPVDEDELTYPIPKGWSTARLGELVRVINGRAYKKPELLDKGTPVLRVGNLFTSRDWYYSDLLLEADKYCDKGDLIFAWSASFGPFIWGGPKVIFHYHIWKLEFFSEKLLNKNFLYTVLLEQTKAIKDAGHGISMAHMTKAKMEQLPIAIPPLSEQFRIVDKVAEFSQICDALEEKLKNSKSVAKNLAMASIVTLTGIAIEQEEEPMKAPQTELVAPLRLGIPPGVKSQAPLATILARHNGEMSAKDLWQRFGGEIDSFYAQLKTEVAHGWVLEPEVAKMYEKTES